MQKLLVGLWAVVVLLSPAAAWAGGYGHHHHHHKGYPAEYVALGILGGVLGGIALGHALSEHTHSVPPPRPVYVPEPAYCGPVYRYVPGYAPRRYCYR